MNSVIQVWKIKSKFERLLRFYAGDHHGHANDGNREGRELECYCVPAEQCPSNSVMHSFGGSNHVQQTNNHVQNPFINQRPAREQLPDPVVRDYSNLINPRILPKDIVAADKEGEDDNDNLDLAEKSDKTPRAR